MLTGDIGIRGISPKQAAILRAQVLWQGTVGTVLFATAVNKICSGHYPWQNQRGHETDIQIGRDRDGAPVYLSSTTVAPEMSRPIRDLSIKDALTMSRETPPGTYPPTPSLKGRGGVQAGPGIGDYARAGFKNAVNAVGEAASSPLTSFAGTALGGIDPFYYTQGLQHLEPLATSQPGATAGQQIGKNLLSAVGGMNPLGQQFMPGQPEFTGQMQSPGWRGAQTATNFLFNNAIKREKGSPGQVAGSQAYFDAVDHVRSIILSNNPNMGADAADRMARRYVSQHER
jgi:hypothetical protein